jgi:glycerol-3-phosphate O-acyltransferase
VRSRELTSLSILSRSLWRTLERYAISTALLAQHLGQGWVNRQEFETQCQLMAQRIAILSGAHDPESYDKGLFRSYLDQLLAQGYVAPLGDDRLAIDARVAAFAESCLSLLTSDIRHSVQRVSLAAENT